MLYSFGIYLRTKRPASMATIQQQSKQSNDNLIFKNAIIRLYFRRKTFIQKNSPSFSDTSFSLLPLLLLYSTGSPSFLTWFFTGLTGFHEFIASTVMHCSFEPPVTSYQGLLGTLLSLYFSVQFLTKILTLLVHSE